MKASKAPNPIPPTVLLNTPKSNPSMNETIIDNVIMVIPISFDQSAIF